MDNAKKIEIFFWYLPKLVEKIPITLLITFISTFIGTIIGVIIAIIRIEKIFILNQLTSVFVSFLRGTPLLVQLFIVYFGLPVLTQKLGFVNFEIDKLLSVYVAFGLNLSAFLSETFRSAFNSVSKNQFEAAQSLGFTKFEMYQHIIIPQALKVAIPDYGSTIVGLLQDTSLAFSIGIVDIMGKVDVLSSIIKRSVEGYIIVAIIYVILSVILSVVFKFVEDKYSHNISLE